MTYRFPDAIMAHHIAVLGKTGSGKTSTEKLVVEQAVADGFRVCVLDTIKSDWWGITSSATGKSAGLPFKILGGPHGHVPLHAAAGKVIGQLVGSGKLPLTIVDMADFEPGGLQRFFVDFATALFRSARGVVYLVIEEAHEVAPKERAGFGEENLSIHWAKKLATAARSKGIRLVVATQSVQQLHNRVLGSCETLIAHRLATPADQEPVVKWMKGNADKVTAERVEASLSSLPTGTGWVCSGEAKIFEQVKFPKFKTYDNTATPEGDAADIAIKTAAVDQNELRTLIGEEVAKAEAADPKALNAKLAERDRRITALEAQLGAAAQNAAADPAALAAAEQRGFEQADRKLKTAAEKAAQIHIMAALQRVKEALAPGLAAVGDELEAARKKSAQPEIAIAFEPPKPARQDFTRHFTPPKSSVLPKPPAQLKRHAEKAGGDGALPGNERRVLDALATWRAIGHDAPTNPQVAWLAAYSPTSTSYTNPRGALRAKRLLDYSSGDRLVLTETGAAIAVAQPINGTLLDHVRGKLPGNERRVLDAAAAFYPKAASNEEAAAAANYSPTSTSYTNPRGALRKKDLITYEHDGVRAVDWLFAA